MHFEGANNSKRFPEKPPYSPGTFIHISIFEKRLSEINCGSIEHDMMTVSTEEPSNTAGLVVQDVPYGGLSDCQVIEYQNQQIW